MRILSNKKYNMLISNQFKGLFEKVNDDMLLRDNANLYAENKRLYNIINIIDSKLAEMGVDDEILDVCEMYDVNGIELRKIIKEFKGCDKE